MKLFGKKKYIYHVIYQVNEDGWCRSTATLNKPIDEKAIPLLEDHTRKQINAPSVMLFLYQLIRKERE